MVHMSFFILLGRNIFSHKNKNFLCGESEVNFFLRFSSTQINDLAASDKTFGFKNLSANSWTFGYQTQSSLGNFTFGVSSPNQLSKGTVSLVTPTGRTKSGDVLYAETEFAVSRDENLDRFTAYQYEKDELAISFGVVEDSKRG